MYFSHACRSDKSGSAQAVARAVGMIVGLALTKGIQFKAHLAPALFKTIFGTPLTVDDLRGISPKAQEFVLQVAQMDATELNAANLRYLSVSADGNTHELVEKGSEIAVSTSNRTQFIAAYVRFQLATDLPLIEFVQGVQMVCPRELLTIFSPRTAAMLVEGLPEVTAEQMRQACDVRGRSEMRARSEAMFWQCVEEMDARDRALLLLFITDRGALPAGGLSQLRPRLLVNIAEASDARLPVSQPSHNSMLLPAYSTTEIMRKRLATVIRYC
eukprot:TRINITY_DN12638_c0_g2_i1.p1 TRINITY_DN12638_c0_g2~~TRINITY_DN12638_c0_g2_i1.p1  ORF type:complete len:272 (+),score=34.86 TRINITY_DN12638_c0_g2_i1:526-1341(+)